MGTNQSADVYRSGEVQGEPVDFFYHVDGEFDQRMLSYATAKDREMEQWTSILANHIIAALPVHHALPDDYTVLHVVKAASEDAKPDADEGIPAFKTIMVTRPPLRFIQDFTPSGLSCWQIQSDRSPENTNLHVIISLTSGTGRADAIFQSLVKPLWTHMGLAEGKDYVIHRTDSEESITNLTKNVLLARANEGRNQAVILLSGDGGLIDILNALSCGHRSHRYSKPNIALLPLGTGNALAHSLKITKDETMGVANMIQGHHQPLPTFRVAFSPGARALVNEGRDERKLHQVEDIPTLWGAVVCSWGLHSGLVADSDTTEYRKHGAQRFQMAAKSALFPEDGSLPHEYRGRVSMIRKGDRSWTTIPRNAHGYILATLVSNLEKSFIISPASRPLDGQLRLIHFGAMSGDEVMGIMGAAYQGGKHVEDERVGYEDIDALRIEFQEDDKHWRRVCIDGKIIRVEKDGWLEVRREVNDVVDVVCAAK